MGDLNKLDTQNKRLIQTLYKYKRYCLLWPNLSFTFCCNQTMPTVQADCDHFYWFYIATGCKVLQLEFSFDKLDFRYNV